MDDDDSRLSTLAISGAPVPLLIQILSSNKVKMVLGMSRVYLQAEFPTNLMFEVVIPESAGTKNDTSDAASAVSMLRACKILILFSGAD